MSEQPTKTCPDCKQVKRETAFPIIHHFWGSPVRGVECRKCREAKRGS